MIRTWITQLGLFLGLLGFQETGSTHAPPDSLDKVSTALAGDFQGTDHGSARTYCLTTQTWDGKDETKCRTLVQVKNMPVNSQFFHFYEKFIATHREIGATTYFQKNADSTYTAYFDSIFDQNKHQLDLNYPENSKVRISIKANGLPKITNITLGKWSFGTQKGHLNASIEYYEDKVIFSGTEHEFDGTQWKDPVPFNDVYHLIK